MTKLIIVGDEAFGEIAYEYFTHDSPYEVVAFAVERTYLTKSELFGIPIVALEDIPTVYDPKEHHVFVALTYGKLNRHRERLFNLVKNLGYKAASYVSSRAFVWRNAEIGENTFIFENNVVQPFVKIGNNTILWSGNHIGHHSVIGNNVFISSHVVVSGYVTIGANCFCGVNSTFANNLTVGKDSWIGPNALVSKDIAEGSLLKSEPTKPSPITSYKFFRI
jgi:sugar O-acyltransferase (sialic acid O-acetyltransferase NeuD family)